MRCETTPPLPAWPAGGGIVSPAIEAVTVKRLITRISNQHCWSFLGCGIRFNLLYIYRAYTTSTVSDL